MKKVMIILSVCSFCALTAYLSFTTPVQANENAEPVMEEIQVLKTAELMKIITDPFYEDLKDAMENPPEARADWRALYVATYQLAEITNLFFARTGEDYLEGKEEEWARLTALSRDDLVALGESIKTQSDYEVIKEKYLQVIDSCNKCHEVFDPENAPDVEPPRSWIEGKQEEAPIPL